MYKLTTNVIEKTNVIGKTLSSCPIKDIIDILKLVIISLIFVWLYKQLFYLQNNENFTQQQKDDQKLKTLSEMITSNCKPEYCTMNSWGIKPPDIPENMSVSNFSTSKGCCLVPNDFKTFLYEKRCGNS
jgi:hypothetical protein